jgi:tetratricopeptide (TPR) repeat protein
VKNIILVLSLLLVSSQINGQEIDFPYPSFSPKGNISQTVGNTLIEVEYERPSVRKRQVFGRLVPWNKVWRTGAGNCTKIKFDKDLKIGGQKVSAGKYSIFTIPNIEEWIVVINKDTSLYGSYDYDFKNDVVRFVVVPTESSRFYETLNFDIELNQYNAKMYISWANTQINFDIETSTNEDIEKLIREELLTGKNKVSDNYASASGYLAYRGVDLAIALKLADKAKELDKNSEWIHGIKVEIYESLKLYDNALEEISQLLIILKKNKEDRSAEIQKMESEYERINKLKK